LIQKSFFPGGIFIKRKKPFGKMPRGLILSGRGLTPPKSSLIIKCKNG